MGATDNVLSSSCLLVEFIDADFTDSVGKEHFDL